MIPKPVVILANGDFPTHPIPLEILKTAKSIICCDGAVNHLEEAGIEPYAIIGDMDSITEPLKEKYKDRLFYIDCQEENDLRKAVKWVEDEEAERAVILGATGKREDHSLANVFTLLHYPSKMELEMLTDYGKFSIAKETQEFESFQGQQVSLFSTNPEIEITSTHLKYTLKSLKLNNLYCGSLNESTSGAYKVDISHGQLLVFQSYA